METAIRTIAKWLLGAPAAFLAVIVWMIAGLIMIFGVLSFVLSLMMEFCSIADWGLVPKAQSEMTAAAYLMIGAFTLWLIAAVFGGFSAILSGLAEALGIQMR